MNKTCPAIKAICVHFDKTIKNKCGIRNPLVTSSGRRMYCKSHTMSKEIKDMGMFSLITSGSRAV